jgi:pseudouridine synthase
MVKERLQKVLASAGIASRRRCEELILEGAVTVNRKVVDRLPVFVDPEKDIITAYGKRIRPAPKLYYILNKPKGVISTSNDQQGRPKAVDMVPAQERVFCVGQLDADTMGLIILTNDTELANRLTHPRYKVPNIYVVRVKGEITIEAVDKLKKGIWLAEGKTEQALVKILQKSRDESLVEVTIKQGLNRQIRRMFAKIGFRVRSLRRTAIGNLTVKGLNVGQSRVLNKSEIEYLQRIGDRIQKTGGRRLMTKEKRAESREK